MTSGQTMDPDSVRTGSAKFGPAADELGEAGSTLQSALDSLGQCWGGDDSGQEFAKDYVPAAQQAVQAFGQLAQALRALQQNVSSAADAVEGADQSAGQTIAAQER